MTTLRVVFKLIGLLFKLVAILLMVLTPLLGVWVSSSIAVFANEGLPWAIGAGLLMFPVLPLLWEAWSAYRRKRKQKTGPRFLNFFDRLVLRTIVLNALFLGGLLATQPKAAFTALSARGDWMLAGAQGPRAKQVRGYLFAAADGLSWLYEAASDNPYRDKGSKKPPPPGPLPQPGTTKPDAKKPGTKKPGTKKPGTTTQPSSTSRPSAPERHRWPQPRDLHPIVASISPEHEKSPAAVGRYIASQTADAFERARAVHDYVADRIAYDAVSLAQKKYPPYDAPTVLQRRSGVCAGYAKLYEAIAQAAELEAVYLTGHARQKDGGLDGIGHAWNGVRIAGRWYLLDATWDSGSVDGTTFKKRLRTIYFLTPPEVFGVDHFPDDKRWQLRDKPLSRGEFIRQPFMRGSFHAAGLKLISPRRPQVSALGQLTVKLEIPQGTYALLSAQRDGASLKASPNCAAPTRGTYDCRFPTAGRYTVHICIARKQYGTYECVGKLLVNAAP